MTPSLNCLAWYKGRPALVTGLGEKITITIAAGKGTESVNVREKDIEVLHPGPVSNLANLIDLNNQNLNNQNYQPNQNQTGQRDQNLRDAWELIESGDVPVTLKELAELVYGEFTPQSAWAARLLLADGLYFTGTTDEVNARSKAELGAAEEKRQGKAKETQEREAFLKRLRSGVIDPALDSRFLQDVEALACQKTDKSRTMKELGRTETPEEAHRLLLECRFWDKWFNPYPRRFGISIGTQEAFSGETISLKKMPALPERRDLTHLTAFAIDSPWSADPDDALSLEIINGKSILYVHVADPASVIESDSPADHAARAQGATLYLPEGALPMLDEHILNHFALGLRETSDNALTFKLTMGSDGVEDTEIFPSIIKVTRLSYEEADNLIDEDKLIEGADVLKELFKLAEANFQRRLNAGAVNIVLPEVHISVSDRKIQILPLIRYRSADMVRECMLLAGEGAAAWAARRQLPFPYITQETGDLPAKPLPGLAGSCQIRRCMRPRSVSAKPGYHWGLGLDGYSQVTSPLRRYTDLLAHQQIRAWLRGEADKKNGAEPLAAPLTEEEVLFRLASGDAAAQAVTQAERASKSHWIAVYLDELLGAGKEAVWDAVITEKRSNGLGIIIPELGLETQIGGTGTPNETIKARLKSARIPELEMIFVEF